MMNDPEIAAIILRLDNADLFPQRESVPAMSELIEHWGQIIQQGDVVIISLPNSLLLLKHYFAVLKNGGVPLLTTPMLQNVRMLELIEIFKARALVKMQINENALGDCVFNQFHNVTVALFAPKNSGYVRAGEAIMTTSGTSGLGSGCIFDFNSLLINAKKHSKSIGLKQEDVVLVNLPLYFSYAFVAQALAALLNGCALVISCPPFDLTSYIHSLNHYGITVSSLTPWFVQKILDANVLLPLSLRVLTVGGDSIPKNKIEQLLRLRPERELYITYGLTEAGPRVATLNAHEESSARLSSVGKPLPETHVSLNKNENESLQGELMLASNTLAKCKIKSNGKEVSVTPLHGILATGDLFRIEDDYLYFQGRISDFLINQGEKVSLKTIRDTVTKIPDVLLAKTQMNKCFNTTSYDLSIYTKELTGELSSRLKKDVMKSLRSYERPNNIYIYDLAATEIQIHK